MVLLLLFLPTSVEPDKTLLRIAAMAKPATIPSSPSPANFDDRSGSEALELVRDLKNRIASQPLPQSDVGSGSENPDHSVQVLEVDIDRLHGGPCQPRRRFSENSLKKLAASIGKTGVLQPIIVRRHETLEGDFEIVAGERRWRAAKLAQLRRVPVMVRELSDLSSLEVALVENVQREDLTPIEIAEAYQRLLTEFRYTQESLSLLLGKSRSHISNTLRLLNLPYAIKELVQEGELTAGHARALLKTEDPEKLAKRVVSQKLSVRKAERLTRASHDNAVGPPGSVDAQEPSAAEEPILSALLGRKVTVSSANENYTITIHCETPKKLYDFIGDLKLSWTKKVDLCEENENNTEDTKENIIAKRNIDAYGQEPKPMSTKDLENLAAELGHEYP